MFLLKKIVSQIIYPVPLIIFISLAIAILIIRKADLKKTKTLISLQIILLIAVSFRPIPINLARSLEKRHLPLLETPSDITTIVVLGGGSSSDPSLPVSSQLSSQSLVRLTEGITHFNNLDSARLIVTGGAVLDTVTIASLQRRMAIQLGVDSLHIEMADRALDTEMEAIAVREMVQEDRIILVTSATHMHRSLTLFRKVGFEPLPAPTDHKAIESPFTLMKLFPSAWSVYVFRSAVHEYFGMAWSSLRGKM